MPDVLTRAIPMNRARNSLLGVIGVILLGAPAWAQPQEPDKEVQANAQDLKAQGTWNLDLTGEYRLSGRGYGDIRLDASGRTLDQEQLFDHRLRFLPRAALREQLQFRADVILAAGIVSGDEPAAFLQGFGNPRGEAIAAFGDNVSYEDQFEVRQLYGVWKNPVGAVILGRMESNWGLGLFVNGGERRDRDWGGARLGSDYNFGDIVNRVAFVTSPLAALGDAKWAKRWIVSVAGELVQRDERIQLERGERAAQAVGSVRFADELNDFGFYVARRGERNHLADTAEYWVFDVAARKQWRLPALDIQARGELVRLKGGTTVPQSVCQVEQRSKLRQLGYALGAGLTIRALGLGGDVDLGYASGDSDLCDGKSTKFRFDPNYSPSLILFDELRALETVASAANTDSSGAAGRFVPGTPSYGAVSGAFYVKPTLRHVWRDLTSRFSVMYARAAEDVVDPFAFNVNNEWRNFQGGAPPARTLGVEINLGVDYVFHWVDKLDIRGSLQAGHLIPGSAFKDATGMKHPSIQALFGQITLVWLPSEFGGDLLQ